MGKVKQPESCHEVIVKIRSNEPQKTHQEWLWKGGVKPRHKNMPVLPITEFKTPGRLENPRCQTTMAAILLQNMISSQKEVLHPSSHCSHSPFLPALAMIDLLSVPMENHSFHLRPISPIQCTNSKEEIIKAKIITNGTKSMCENYWGGRRLAHC